MKMPTSDSYRESLIECLKEPEEAGGFIGAILEEKDPEPALLRNAIRKWGRVDIDGWLVLNIIRKTRPHTTKNPKLVTSSQSGGGFI
jgi:hypothetical protein